MAKRKKATRKRASTKKKSYSRRKKSGMTNEIMTVAGGMAYGGGREFVSQQMANLTKGTSLNFIGEYSDEVTMGVLSWALAKGKIPFLNKFKVLKEVGKAGLYIESARVGSNLIAPMINQSTTTETSSGNIF